MVVRTFDSVANVRETVEIIGRQVTSDATNAIRIALGTADIPDMLM